MVGTVEAVGSGVGPGLVGRRVAGTAEDAYAEYAVSDAAWLVPVPDRLDAGAACMLPLAAPVALGSLRHGRLAPGETDAGVDYTADDWPDRVRKIAPDGVDLVLESVGGDVLRRSFDVLSPAGRVLVYGAASGDLGAIPVTSLFSLHSAIGFVLHDWRAAAPDRARTELAEVTDWSRRGPAAHRDRHPPPADRGGQGPPPAGVPYPPRPHPADPVAAGRRTPSATASWFRIWRRLIQGPVLNSLCSRKGRNTEYRNSKVRIRAGTGSEMTPGVRYREGLI